MGAREPQHFRGANCHNRLAVGGPNGVAVVSIIGSEPFRSAAPVSRYFPDSTTLRGAPGNIGGQVPSGDQAG